MAKNSNRDDFSHGIVLQLAKRVAWRCSKPDCDVSTISGNPGDDGVRNTGRAAHITAASPKGPRYDATQTPQQRKAVKNGIWLCANHASEVDSDTSAYSVETLHGWKAQAEKLARDRQNKKQPHPDDAMRTVTQALTGESSRLVMSAIPNTHKGVSAHLEKLDPRFQIETSYGKAGAKYDVSARSENVKVRLEITLPKGEGKDLVARHFLHGDELKVPLDQVKLTGSPLLDYIKNDMAGGQMVLSPAKHPAEFRITLSDKKEGAWQFDSIVGHVTGGSRSITFSGLACDGLVSLSWCGDAGTTPMGVTTSFQMHLSRWVGVDVRGLPYWRSIFALVTRLARGDAVTSILLARGQELNVGRTGSPAQFEALKPTATLLYFAEAVRAIAQFTGRSIPFDTKLPSSETYYAVLQAAAETRGRVLKRSMLGKNPVLAITVPDALANAGWQNGELAGMDSIAWEEDVEPVEVFGLSVPLPDRQCVARQVGLKLVGGASKPVVGEPAQFELLLDEDSEVSISLTNAG